LEASREAGIEVNTERAKNMAMSRHQIAEQSRNVLIVNKCFQSVAKFKYLETTGKVKGKGKVVPVL
jgi:hypothetical protein